MVREGRKEKKGGGSAVERFSGETTKLIYYPNCQGITLYIVIPEDFLSCIQRMLPGARYGPVGWSSCTTSTTPSNMT